MATGLLINELSDKTLQLKVDSSPNQAPLNKTPKQQGPSANSNPAPENKLAERSVYSQDKQPEQKLPKELEQVELQPKVSINLVQKLQVPIVHSLSVALKNKSP